MKIKLGSVRTWSLGVFFASTLVLEQVQTLDRAQAAFEAANPEWNWEGWRSPEWDHHGGHGLHCKDSPAKQVRTCSVLVPVFMPGESEDTGGRELKAFACSRKECLWVFEP